MAAAALWATAAGCIDPAEPTTEVSATSGSSSERTSARDGKPTSPPTAALPTTPTKPSHRRTPTATPTSEHLRLAFAGDVHFEGQLRPRLDDPETALEPIRPALERADLTMVNLETAIATKDTPEPKNYTFRAPPEALDALAAAGVDVVTMANNHGVDQGADGLAETLAAIEDSPIGVVGIGADEDAAFAPYVVRAQGRDVAFLGATAFPDPTTENWPAGPEEPGVAVALDPARLLTAVREARSEADVLVVYVHWGIERVACPTAEQQELAEQLAEAGADVVVGSHAHIQQGAGLLRDTYVAYGLGNFVWYSRNSTAEGTTGVLELTLDEDGVVDSHWTPALVGADGLPHPVSATEADAYLADFAALRECTGLDPAPGLNP